MAPRKVEVSSVPYLAEAAIHPNLRLSRSPSKISSGVDTRSTSNAVPYGISSPRDRIFPAGKSMRDFGRVARVSLAIRADFLIEQRHFFSRKSGNFRFVDRCEPPLHVAELLSCRFNDKTVFDQALANRISPGAGRVPASDTLRRKSIGRKADTRRSRRITRAYLTSSLRVKDHRRIGALSVRSFPEMRPQQEPSATSGTSMELRCATAAALRRCVDRRNV